MSAGPPLPADLWDSLPPEARALILALRATDRRRAAEQIDQHADCEATEGEVNVILPAFPYLAESAMPRGSRLLAGLGILAVLTALGCVPRGVAWLPDSSGFIYSAFPNDAARAGAPVSGLLAG